MKTSNTKKCFEPWVNSKTKFLIIGTIPGEISIKHKTYYANPRNKFWPYLFKILNHGFFLKEPEARKKFLFSYSLGLWDALACCERIGSLDAKIRKEIPNNFDIFPQIKHFFFNGQKAFFYFKKYNGKKLTEDNFTVLPSTSPANASISETVKFARWQEAVNFIWDEG